MCQATVCENHQAPRLCEWEQEQQERIDRAYAPALPPADTLRRAIVAEMRARNAASPLPDPVCRDCGYPFDEEQRDQTFKHRCSTCGIQRLEKLVRKTQKRLGRKRAVRALKKLARGS